MAEETLKFVKDRRETKVKDEKSRVRILNAVFNHYRVGQRELKREQQKRRNKSSLLKDFKNVREIQT